MTTIRDAKEQQEKNKRLKDFCRSQIDAIEEYFDNNYIEIPHYLQLSLGIIESVRERGIFDDKSDEDIINWFENSLEGTLSK